MLAKAERLEGMKAKLKRRANEAKALIERAIKLGDTPPPADRPWPYMDTPPIEGFDHRKINSKGDDEEDDDEEA